MGESYNSKSLIILRLLFVTCHTCCAKSSSQRVRSQPFRCVLWPRIALSGQNTGRVTGFGGALSPRVGCSVRVKRDGGIKRWGFWYLNMLQVFGIYLHVFYGCVYVFRVAYD
jgi:hypothetical protein